ncbi:LysR family transcriptional regulator [Streptosporangium sp. NPDC000396]|uniref:LysR family transcriptional regulator n=1 Tax=Streptosporangium sp. NPDC000396 TaxID=3366185 RepID=UPI0036C87478
MDLNLRLVEVLRVVAEEGSMTKAATQLHVTQQAISGQIHQLERLAGTELLTRTSRGVELTSGGKVVAQLGAEMLAIADKMLAELRLVKQGQSGLLRIACKPQTTAHFLPEAVANMRQEAPGIEIEMTSVSVLREEVELMMTGHVDGALIWLPLGDDRLNAVEIEAEPRLLALPPDHPLAGRESVTIPEVADEPFVGAHSRLPSEVTRFWLVDPRPDGGKPVYGPEGRTTEECLQLIADHRGVMIGPASYADYYKHPHLAWVPLADVEPCVLALAWPKNVHNVLLDTFARHCRAVAGDFHV